MRLHSFCHPVIDVPDRQQTVQGAFLSEEERPLFSSVVSDRGFGTAVVRDWTLLHLL